MPRSTAELSEAGLTDWPFWYRVQNPGIFGADSLLAQSRASAGRGLAVNRNRFAGDVRSAKRTGKGRIAGYADVRTEQGRCDEGMRVLEKLRIAEVLRAELKRHGAGPTETVGDILGRGHGSFIDKAVARETRRWESDENEDVDEIQKADVKAEARAEGSQGESKDIECPGTKEAGQLVDV